MDVKPIRVTADGREVLAETDKVILCKWNDQYVTWAKDGGRDIFNWGHYYHWWYCTQEEAYKMALKDFAERAERGF